MEKHFLQKTLAVAAIGLGAVIIFLGLKAGFHLLLLVFAGALIAVYFRRVAELLENRTTLNYRQSLTIVIIGTLAIIGGFVFAMGARISEQTQDLQGDVPTLTQAVNDKLSTHPAGRWLVEQGKTLQDQGGSTEIVSVATSFFRGTFGALGDLYIILILAMYFTVTPNLYRDSIIALFPASKRKKAENTMYDMYEALGKWIVGQLIAMVIVAVATGAGLAIMGIPYALLFALLAGALNFIPNFGPLIAMIPVVLVALTVSPGLALGVIILYVVIQNIEGEFITPLIQQKMVNLPPAYIILFQVFMGIIGGGIGLVIATPLLAVIVVLIQKLYIKPIADKV